MQLRVSGVLLHFASLPSRYGIGDFGPEAHAFARLLAETGQTIWQFLPLTPTSPGIGNSPYSSPSAFAGSKLFISPDMLLEEGFVTEADIDAAGAASTFPHSDAVQYEQTHCQRKTLLQKAFDRNGRALETDPSFRAFVAENHYWLEDWARFVTIKESQNGAPWTAWPEALARRDAYALRRWDASEAEHIQRERFCQYLFYRQWGALRTLCTRLGIRLVGDVPIYITHDSADVWANTRLFQLNERGDPIVVAGVPPDYFSPTGQRWGNPLYAWEVLAREDFLWWTRRLEHNFRLFDCVRLDHFRGFAGYWAVPAHEETAVNGCWMPAPGHALFAALTRKFPHLPIIAEDLGIITPDVRALQRELGCPGMAVLQFGFNGNLRENVHTPFMHRSNLVVYTGTHDNPPTRGWFRENASWEEKQTLASYAGHDITEENAAPTLIRLALASVADMAVIPMQDILGLDMPSRMNTPSTVTGNWCWRLLPGQCTRDSLDWLARTTAFFGRDAGRRQEGI